MQGEVSDFNKYQQATRENRKKATELAQGSSAVPGHCGHSGGPFCGRGSGPSTSPSTRNYQELLRTLPNVPGQRCPTKNHQGSSKPHALSSLPGFSLGIGQLENVDRWPVTMAVSLDLTQILWPAFQPMSALECARGQPLPSVQQALGLIPAEHAHCHQALSEEAATAGALSPV